MNAAFPIGLEVPGACRPLRIVNRREIGEEEADANLFDDSYDGDFTSPGLHYQLIPVAGGTPGWWLHQDVAQALQRAA